MSDPGVIAADKTLDRLITLAARRVFTAGDLIANAERVEVSFKATSASLPEYFLLPRFSDRQEYHARLRPLVDIGALSWEWDRRAGSDTQLDRVTLRDPEVVAQHLNIELPWIVARAACDALVAASKGQIALVNDVIEAWRSGRSPAGVAATDANKFVDAVRVILAAKALGTQSRDIIERRLSTQLFSNSKRIEQIQKPIAYLLGLGSSDDDASAIAALGLVKHPAPILLSGPSGSTLVTLISERALMIQPYIGCSPHTLSHIETIDSRITTLLTIENLASFNEAALSAREDHLLVMYVPGNPTPALLQAYRRLLVAVQPRHVLHWGDIDVGGYRIASRLANVASAEGYCMKLWRMNAQLDALQAVRKAEPRELDAAVRICTEQNWYLEADGLKSHPYFQEQESMEFNQPQPDSL